MHLLKYKVNKFRSVEETEWIEIDQWSCFVGVNESGKTNLLLPLWKFNPADTTIEIDGLEDYPRSDYSDFKSNDDKKREPFIGVLFSLGESELSEIEEAYEAYLNPPQENSEGQENDNASEVGEKKIPKTKIKFTKHLLIEKDYSGNFYINISNKNCEVLIGNIKQYIGDEGFKKIIEMMPKFIYYEEYGNLDSDLHLQNAKSTLSRINELTGKERIKARTLKVLFDYVKLDMDEIIEQGKEANENEGSDAEVRKKDERDASVNAAASKLTKHFKNWWTQDEYTFVFRTDGQYFRIYVTDRDRPERIKLESRSKGLQWFFNFFLVFLVESDNMHKDCILLLDEPGLHLHPSAQKDLINFFDKLSEKNQLIYTTHLPFLVDHSRLERVKAVYSENGLSKASNDLSKADKEKKAIQPVNAAIGIAASESLLVGCDIVIVEGITDQFYLTMIRDYLLANTNFKPKRQTVFIPAKGVKSIPPIASIIQGRNEKLPIVLLDSDAAGKDFKKNLKNKLYSVDEGKILEMDTFIANKKGAEIEDLIPAGFIIDNFNRLFRPENDFSKECLKKNNSIVPQLEKFAADNDIILEKSWKAQMGKRIKENFNGKVDEETAKIWKNLFDSLQKAQD